MTIDTRQIRPAGRSASDAPRGVHISAVDLRRVSRDGKTLLDGVSLEMAPSSLVAIAGGSGAGKTTLLEALAGVRPVTGTVRYGGVDLARNLDRLRTLIGYVPQDDVVHRDLPVAATLRYAARLRLPSHVTAEEIDRVVRRRLDELGLAGHASAKVGTLSGGQRKRASIGAELVSAPVALFLDEPTSGLDPATARSLISTLRRLADQGCTVVFTTHSVQDLEASDEVVLLAPGGRLAYQGRPASALGYFGVGTLAEIYDELATGAPVRSLRPVPAHRAADPSSLDDRAAGGRRSDRPAGTGLRQFGVLTRRNLALLRSSRLTTAIMVGSPAMVIAMFAVLFRPGAFGEEAASGSSAVMIAFWMAFAGFFFGLTYGLLQVCTEVAVLRRERAVGLGIGPYVASKCAVLVPVLASVVVGMILVLRFLDRLPEGGLDTYGPLAVTLLLDAAAALALGLLVSAAVADPSQATIALPMLCFPAVLFSGAILPVGEMAAAGEALSVVTPARWAFEAVASELSAGSFDQAAGPRWAALAAFAAVFLVAGRIVTARRATGL